MAGEPESLDQDEDMAARDRRHAYDRMIMLSDGVFAIAITLLAFDIRPPDGWNGHFANAWLVIAPELSAFVMGFVVISFYWLVHRRLVSMMAHVDSFAIALNLLLLGLLALVPVSARFTVGPHSDPSSVLLNTALVMSIGASLSLFWGYAAFVRPLVFPAVVTRARWVGLLAPVLAPAIMLAATAGIGLPANVVPPVLVVLFIPIWMLIQRFLRPPARAAGESHAPAPS